MPSKSRLPPKPKADDFRRLKLKIDREALAARYDAEASLIDEAVKRGATDEDDIRNFLMHRRRSQHWVRREPAPWRPRALRQQDD